MSGSDDSSHGAPKEEKSGKESQKKTVGLAARRKKPGLSLPGSEGGISTPRENKRPTHLTIDTGGHALPITPKTGDSGQGSIGDAYRISSERAFIAALQHKSRSFDAAESALEHAPSLTPHADSHVVPHDRDMVVSGKITAERDIENAILGNPAVVSELCSAISAGATGFAVDGENYDVHLVEKGADGTLLLNRGDGMHSHNNVFVLRIRNESTGQFEDAVMKFTTTLPEIEMHQALAMKLPPEAETGVLPILASGGLPLRKEIVDEGRPSTAEPAVEGWILMPKMEFNTLATVVTLASHELTNPETSEVERLAIEQTMIAALIDMAVTLSFMQSTPVSFGVHGEDAPVRIMHQDLKPANWLLDQKGRLWLTDFGVSAAITPGHDYATSIGASFFKSPEFLAYQSGLPAGFDPCLFETWSIGVTLAFMLGIEMQNLTEGSKGEFESLVQAQEYVAGNYAIEISAAQEHYASLSRMTTRYSATFVEKSLDDPVCQLDPKMPESAKKQIEPYLSLLNTCLQPVSAEQHQSYDSSPRGAAHLLAVLRAHQQSLIARAEVLGKPASSNKPSPME